MTPIEQVPELLEQGKNWDQSAREKERREQKRDRIFSYIGMGVGTMGIALAVLVLVLRAEPAPYLVQFDKARGFVDEVKSLKEPQISHGDAYDEHFINMFLQCREAYLRPLVSEQYRVCKLLTGSGAAKQQLDQAFDAKYAKYMEQGIAIVQAVGISPLPQQPGTAMIRYQKVEQMGGEPAPKVSWYTATVAFEYTGKPMRLGERVDNPGGFTVKAFQTNVETAPVAELK